MPALIGLELDPGVFGMPFYAMDEVRGIVPVQWRGDDPAVFPDDAARHRLGVAFVDTLADIHAIDWRSAGLDAALPGPGDTDPATAEIDRWEQFLDGSVTVELPVLRRGDRAGAAPTAPCPVGSCSVTATTASATSWSTTVASSRCSTGSWPTSAIRSRISPGPA